MEKIEEQDKQKYLELQKEYATLIAEAGQIFLEKTNIQEREKALLDSLKEYKDKSHVFLSEIKTRYDNEAEFFDMIDENS